MSSDPRQPPNDQELEDFLAGTHPVSNAYRAANSKEPGVPAELDALILGQAKEAVRSMPRRRARWIQPMAVAAALMLSFGVLINIWRDPAKLEQAVPSPSTVAVETSRDAEVVEHEQLPEISGVAEARRPAPDKTAEDVAELKEASPPRAVAAQADEQLVEPVRKKSVAAASRPAPQAKAELSSAPIPVPAKAEAFPADAPPPTAAPRHIESERDNSRMQETQRAEIRAQSKRQRKAEQVQLQAAPPPRSMMKAQPESFSDSAAQAFSEEGLRERTDEGLDAERLIQQMRDAVRRDNPSKAQEILKRYRARFPHAELPQDLRFLDAAKSNSPEEN